MPVIIVLCALVAWALFGSPKNDTANLLWPNDAAPWEAVDAFYYPDRNDLTQHVAMRGFDTVDKCRDWVGAAAANNRDAGLLRGDYECAVGKMDDLGGLSVYRLTIR